MRSRTRGREGNWLADALVGLLLAAAVLVALHTFAGGGGAEAPVPADAAGMQQARLVRVVDGDTLVVDDGGEAYVRLIGIDAPESVHDDPERNTEEGLEASEYLKSLLSDVDTVYLEKDVSDTDRYGRLLRYAYFMEGGELAFLNERIVEDGYARAVRYAPDTRRAEDLEAAQERATAKGAGVSRMWEGGR